ncbi:MAG: YbjN domain-containing protein [Polyangiales bacterium]
MIPSGRPPKSALQDAQLSAYLERLEWERERVGDAHFRTTHKTSEGDFVIDLQVRRAWLVARVDPFLDTGGDNSFELSRWLLRQNWDMPQAKFGYDTEGRVVLTVELPTEYLDYVEVETALRTLLSATVKHRRTLREAVEQAQP